MLSIASTNFWRKLEMFLISYTWQLILEGLHALKITLSYMPTNNHSKKERIPRKLKKPNALRLETIIIRFQHIWTKNLRFFKLWVLHHLLIEHPVLLNPCVNLCVISLMIFITIISKAKLKAIQILKHKYHSLKN